MCICYFDILQIDIKMKEHCKMVKVYFELEDSDIISTSKYFNNSYTEEWLDEWAERVIRGKRQISGRR